MTPENRLIALDAAPGAQTYTCKLWPWRLVPRALKARGHGADYLRGRKRGRCDKPAATPPPRARRPRRAVNYDDSEPDADED